jgi:sugar O-acyltransferase (sialic acid O-acetyltransferase NeuD family)
MDKKTEIILLGAGGHCRSCIDVIEAEGRFSIAGIVDRVEAGAPASVLGYPVIGTDDDLPELRKQYAFALVTVGQTRSSTVRRRLFDVLQALGFELPTVVSPHAYVSSHAQVGAGTIVMHHALVNAGASVGENCIINTKALIEHDAQIAEDCHISTGAILNGGVNVGAGTFFGSNAVSVQEISIPAGSFIRAGHLERGKS